MIIAGWPGAQSIYGIGIGIAGEIGDNAVVGEHVDAAVVVVIDIMIGSVVRVARNVDMIAEAIIIVVVIIVIVIINSIIIDVVIGIIIIAAGVGVVIHVHVFRMALDLQQIEGAFHFQVIAEI